MKYWTISINFRLSGYEAYTVSHPTKPTEAEVIDSLGLEGTFNPEEETIEIEEFKFCDIEPLFKS